MAGYILMGMAEYGAWLVMYENYSEETIRQSLMTIFSEGITTKQSEGTIFDNTRCNYIRVVLNYSWDDIIQWTCLQHRYHLLN